MRSALALAVVACWLVAGSALAREVQVDGYYRANGTYVAPHVRSAPDGVKWNNYGPSSSGSGAYSYGGTPPATRDSDRDGIANMYDHDDDNNGIGDDDE